MRVIAIALALIAAATAAADSRTYTVSVENKSAGQYVVKVAEKDGMVTVTASSKVEVKHLLGKYRYELDSTETWKDGKLTGMKTTSNDDGKKHDVALSSDGTATTLTADGRTVKSTATLWTTSYWKLPPAAGNVTLVETDTGKLMTAKLEKVGEDKVRVLGKEQAATKYRLTGAVDITLWYDADGRLVRESFVDTRRQTVLELTEQSDK
jgi:hypothetical protein